MLALLGNFLSKALFESFHEVQEIFCHVLLLANLLSIVVIVDDIVQDGRWIHVFLVSEHEVRHELLQMRGHDCALLLSCQDLKFLFLCLSLVGVFWLNILCEFCLLKVLIRDISVKELVGDIGQEKESLDE